MRRLLAALLLSAVVPLIAPAARADDFADQVDRLTGVDTPASLAVDKEVLALLKALSAAQAEASSLPLGPDRRKAVAEASALEKQGLDRALAAGELRATAANEQRCLALSSKALPPGSGPTSGYLCEAVRSAQAGGDANDPWLVCACTRQYLLGVNAELEAIRARAGSFAGIRRVTREGEQEDGYFKLTPDGIISVTLSGEPAPDVWFREPVTADEIVRLFGAEAGKGGGDPAKPRGWDFLNLARQAQRQVAQLHFFQQATGQPDLGKRYFATPKDRELALLTPAKRDAYARIQDAIRTLWHLHQLDGAFRLARIEQRLTEQARAAEGPFLLRMDGIAADIGNRQDLDDDEKNAAWQKAKATHCPAFVAARKREIESAIDEARAAVQEVYGVRRRLQGDAVAWKAFALKDAAGTGDQAGIPYRDEDFGRFIGETLGLDPATFSAQNVDAGKLETGWTFFVPSYLRPLPRATEGGNSPWCSWADFFFQDPAAAYWKSDSAEDVDAYNRRLLAAAQAQIPEVETISGSIWLRFRIDAQGHESEAVVGGAANGEQP
jgi:hypothetical protein